ncbi:MAG TPA: DUF4097 family beta strand repeat-containing protein [Ktedonosporobacter sp.]|nr:DUF4097 family beta strand repeat-containing protein [Ktedonosporobacter sp.]
MSQQEMLPPWEKGQPETYNADPREQPREQQAWQEGAPTQTSYEAGYSGTASEWMSSAGEKLRPSQVRPTPAWQWIIGAIIILALAPVIWSVINFILGSLVLILGLAVAAIAISLFFVRTVVMPTRIFSLDGRPALVIQNPAGSIRIRSGITNNVEVTATKHISGWFANDTVETLDFVQDGNTIHIVPKSNYRWSPLGGVRNVNLDITLPEHCDIQLHSDAGTIKIEGISGQVKGATNAGTIDVQQATLEGLSNLNTNAGTIHLEQTKLNGNMRFHTDAGTIHFDGEIDPRGDYRFDTNMGTVDVTLPADSSFTLMASTDLGSVSNQFASTTVGPSPHARLNLKSNLGSVTVRKR